MRKLHKFSRSRSHSRHNSAFSLRRESIEVDTDSQTAPDLAIATKTPNDSPLPKQFSSTGQMNGQKMNNNNNYHNPSTPVSVKTSSRHTPSNSIASPISAAPPSLSVNGLSNGNLSSSSLANANGGLGRMPSTIRPVSALDDGLASDSSCDSPSARNSAFSSSINSATSNSSSFPSQANGIESVDSDQTVRLKPAATTTSAPLRTPERPPPSAHANGEYRSALRGPRESPAAHATGDVLSSPPNGEDDGLGQGGWDSTIGKAGLGKTGRVINKLVSDNEALKRDIKIERLKAEEAKQSAKLLESKMDHLSADYESRLLEAQVTKTLLSRKERQVETLLGTVDQEKKRAVDALGREKNWRDEMEKAQVDATRRVEEAENRSLMHEGRYNAISSHWQDQGDEVKKATGKLRRDIAGLVEERRKDDEKISVLRDLCDQQDGNIRELTEQKEAMTLQFDEYKAEQERALCDIKTKAREAEEEQARMLKETKEVLDKLKWALNVNQMNLKS